MEEPQHVFNDSLDLSIGTINGWIIDGYTLLPNFIAGLIILGLFIGLGLAIKHVTTRYFNRRDRIDLGYLVSDIVFWITFIIGSLIALTILIPSLKPGDLVSGFGLGSLAIGFVFKDIIQNWFAGLLILVRLPFRRGDQIKIGETEGTVQRIEPRATIIRTYDGKDVVIPNNTVYTGEVVIQTSQKRRRVEIDITVGYDYDINTIREIIITALEPIEEILKEPEVQVLCWELGATSLGLKIRWWISSERSNEVISRARTVQAIKEAFQANDIDPTDPALIYNVNMQKTSANEVAAISQPGKSIKKAPPPPEYKMGADDPETYTPKADSKTETLLPKDELQ